MARSVEYRFANQGGKVNDKLPSGFTAVSRKPAAAKDRFVRIVMAVLWPSFLMACAASGVVFSLIDPAELVLLDTRIHLSSLGVYTVGFFVFWFLGAIASGLTALLLIDA
jgi:hypothetical protein